MRALPESLRDAVLPQALAALAEAAMRAGLDGPPADAMSPVTADQGATHCWKVGRADSRSAAAARAAGSRTTRTLEVEWM